jgi:hypothetical protein
VMLLHESITYPPGAYDTHWGGLAGDARPPLGVGADAYALGGDQLVRDAMSPGCTWVRAFQRASSLIHQRTSAPPQEPNNRSCSFVAGFDGAPQLETGARIGQVSARASGCADGHLGTFW